MEASVYEKLAEWLVATGRALPGVNGAELKDLTVSIHSRRSSIGLHLEWDAGTLDTLLDKTGMKKEELIPLIRAWKRRARYILNRIPIIQPMPWVLKGREFMRRLNMQMFSLSMSSHATLC